MRSTNRPPHLKTTRHKRTSRSSPKPSRRLSKGIWLLKAIILLAIWGSVCLGAFVVWFGYDLPDIGRLQAVTRKPGISIVGQDGTLIATYGDIYGSTVAQKNLPPYIPQAILATEDRRFYKHFGID